MLTVILSIIIFGLLIGVHEAGHLFAAKKCGILVHEFAIGMGPKLFSFKRGETVYSLRLIPIGGFCNMEGENSDSDSERAFCNKHPFKRIIVLVSGAAMNILLGFIAVCIMFSFSDGFYTTQVKTIDENSNAYIQGLKRGDIIKEINGHTVFTRNDIDNEMYFSNGEDVSLEVLRDGEKIELNITPYEDQGRFLIGITFEIQDNNFINLISYSVKYVFSTCRIILSSLLMLISGSIPFKETSGPVGIISVINTAASGAFDISLLLRVLNILSLISINLGLFNLIPFPALDGGRTAFALFELIFKKKVPEKVETFIHGFGMILLLGLMVFVTYNDILKLF